MLAVLCACADTTDPHESLLAEYLLQTHMLKGRRSGAEPCAELDTAMAPRVARPRLTKLPNYRAMMMMMMMMMMQSSWQQPAAIWVCNGHEGTKGYELVTSARHDVQACCSYSRSEQHQRNM